MDSLSKYVMKTRSHKRKERNTVKRIVGTKWIYFCLLSKWRDKSSLSLCKRGRRDIYSGGFGRAGRNASLFAKTGRQKAHYYGQNHSCGRNDEAHKRQRNKRNNFAGRR